MNIQKASEPEASNSFVNSIEFVDGVKMLVKWIDVLYLHDRVYIIDVTDLSQRRGMKSGQGSLL